MLDKLKRVASGRGIVANLKQTSLPRLKCFTLSRETLPGDDACLGEHHKNGERILYYWRYVASFMPDLIRLNCVALNKLKQRALRSANFTARFFNCAAFRLENRLMSRNVGTFREFNERKHNAANNLNRFGDSESRSCTIFIPSR